jgi:hypothetical protein
VTTQNVDVGYGAVLPLQPGWLFIQPTAQSKHDHNHNAAARFPDRAWSAREGYRRHRQHLAGLGITK